MGRSSLLERIGSVVIAEREAEIDLCALRWLWSGWAASALLGFLAPLYRGTTHIHGGVAIAAAVFVMLGVAAATRRPMVCLTMSSFGLIAGSTAGFGLLAALTYRPLTLAITVQMALGAIFLGRLFRRELRPKPPVPEDPFWEELKTLPKEEARALAAARLEGLRTEMNEVRTDLERMERGTNLLLVGGGIALIGGAVMVVGRRTPLGGQALYYALPLMAIGLVVVLAGTWINWKVLVRARSSRKNVR